MNKSDVLALNREYGIPDQVTFLEGSGGLARIDVANARATASIVLQGAHLVSWTPHGELPVIWLSSSARFVPGKPIRGGVPICWPWFGPHSSDASFPAHGFARVAQWKVIATQALADGATRLVFSLLQNDATRAYWPHATELELHISVGTALEFVLLTRNTDSKPVTVGDALHTYFQVGDVRGIVISGLDGCSYVDKVDQGKRKRQMGPLTIDAETDRIYLESIRDCLIDDPGLRRRLRISKRGSRSMIVWNPWVEKARKMGDLGEDGYLTMICVESANAADDTVTIAPGEEHRLWVRYQVEPMS
ncbi:MAG: D-hexose-6-phosphate mutarotase [Pseudomonadota bacterium]